METLLFPLLTVATTFLVAIALKHVISLLKNIRRGSRSDCVAASVRMGVGTAVIAGAFAAHLFAFVLMFLKGFVLGEGRFMSATGGLEYGIEGGTNGIAMLVFMYFFSYGMVPLVITIVGAILGSAFASTDKDSSKK